MKRQCRCLTISHVPKPLLPWTYSSYGTACPSVTTPTTPLNASTSLSNIPLPTPPIGGLHESSTIVTKFCVISNVRLQLQQPPRSLHDRLQWRRLTMRQAISKVESINTGIPSHCPRVGKAELKHLALLGRWLFAKDGCEIEIKWHRC